MRNRKEIEKRVFFPHSVCVRSYHPPLTLHASLRHLLSGNPFARTAHTGLFSDRWSKGTYEDAWEPGFSLGKDSWGGILEPKFLHLRYDDRKKHISNVSASSWKTLRASYDTEKSQWNRETLEVNRYGMMFDVCERLVLFCSKHVPLLFITE